jgi:hypothetical protein
VRLGKIKCAAICVGLCGWLQLFLFCEGLAFCLSFSVCLSLVVSSFRVSANGHTYEMLGIAGSSLSAVTKANAGQNISSNHLTPNILYMMCAPCMSRAHLLQATVKFQNYK